MDNLKYYNDSFAYDYAIFTPSVKKKAEIHEYPDTKCKVNVKAKARHKKNALLTRNIVISALVVVSVCLSLFLRAEICSLRSEINEIDSAITELESESTRLSVELERKISVTNLEQAAIELGMQKLEKSQVTYIQTNNIDTAENSDGELTIEVE